jgi:hypothetical protein
MGLCKIDGGKVGRISKLASVFVDASDFATEGGSGNRACHQYHRFFTRIDEDSKQMDEKNR